MKKFPMLYKVDAKGAVREWEIYSADNMYFVTFGMKNGQKQVTQTICEGKNIGKSNQTTAQQQAELEAEALWTKQRNRNGYSLEIKAYDDFIQPMLALDYTKVGHRVTDEMFIVQPKLDGVRCIYRPDLGKFQSRKGTLYNLPELEAALAGCEDYLDGEIYLHETPLNHITSATKKRNELTDQLEFWVFDVVDGGDTYEKRYDKLLQSVYQISHPKVKAVLSKYSVLGNLKEDLQYFMSIGYEGVMIRQVNYPYEKGKRTPALLKYKEFQDAEFLVVNMKQDKEGGAVLHVTDGNNVFFDVRMKGTDEERKHQWEHKDEYLGRMVTVKYQTLTEFGVPQFPVGIGFRDD